MFSSNFVNIFLICYHCPWYHYIWNGPSNLSAIAIIHCQFEFVLNSVHSQCILVFLMSILSKSCVSISVIAFRPITSTQYKLSVLIRLKQRIFRLFNQSSLTCVLNFSLIAAKLYKTTDTIFTFCSISYSNRM